MRLASHPNTTMCLNYNLGQAFYPQILRKGNAHHLTSALKLFREKLLYSKGAYNSNISWELPIPIFRFVEKLMYCIEHITYIARKNINFCCQQCNSCLCFISRGFQKECPVQKFHTLVWFLHFIQLDPNQYPALFLGHLVQGWMNYKMQRLGHDFEHKYFTEKLPEISYKTGHLINTQSHSLMIVYISSHSSLNAIS